MTHREQTLAALNQAGFASENPLPPEREASLAQLRSHRQIALRLFALEAVFSWAAAPEEAMSSERLRAYAKRNHLEEEMTEEELEIWQADRDDAAEEHGESIGWLLENLWPLAWSLGFAQPPSIQGGLMSENVMQEIFDGFLPGLDGSLDAFLARATPRIADEVRGLEDLFLCAEAIARSEKPARRLPRSFDPVSNPLPGAPGLDGDLLRERLHALRWSLSPEMDWDDEGSEE